MVIVASAETYIRPHRHFARPKSLHVIEGAVDAVFFHDDGDIKQMERLVPYGTGGTFCYRVNNSQYHTQVLHSPWLFFVEATLGPFDPDRSGFAPWSPAKDETVAIVRFREALGQRIQEYRGSHGKNPAPKHIKILP